MIGKEALQQLLAPIVESLGYELFGCELHRNHRCALLRIYIDRLGSVSLEDCAKISRQISAVLDVEDPISGRYDLEVSSPGIERPLFTIDHYKRYVGNEVMVRLKVPRQGQRNFRGVIKVVEGEKITLQLNEGSLAIDMGEVDKGRLMMSSKV